jgi:hypothetical protein
MVNDHRDKATNKKKNTKKNTKTTTNKQSKIKPTNYLDVV